MVTRARMRADHGGLQERDRLEVNRAPPAQGAGRALAALSRPVPGSGPSETGPTGRYRPSSRSGTVPRRAGRPGASTAAATCSSRIRHGRACERSAGIRLRVGETREITAGVEVLVHAIVAQPLAPFVRIARAQDVRVEGRLLGSAHRRGVARRVKAPSWSTLGSPASLSNVSGSASHRVCASPPRRPKHEGYSPKGSPSS